MVSIWKKSKSHDVKKARKKEAFFWKMVKWKKEIYEKFSFVKSPFTIFDLKQEKKNSKVFSQKKSPSDLLFLRKEKGEMRVRNFDGGNFEMERKKWIRKKSNYFQSTRRKFYIKKLKQSLMSFLTHSLIPQNYYN